jgi:hypothetical protein
MSIKAKPFLLKLFLFQLILSAFLAYPFKAEAQVRVRSVPGQLLRADLNQTSRGRAIIPVLQLISQQEGVRLRGPEIERIILAARPLGNRMVQARLLINDIVSTSLKPISLRSGRVVFPSHEIGVILQRQVLRSLKIEVIGEAILDSVQVRVSSIPFPHGQDIIIPVNQTLMSGQSLPLISLLPLSSRHLLNTRSLVLEVMSAGPTSRMRPILQVTDGRRTVLAQEEVSGHRELIQVFLPLGSRLDQVMLESRGSISILSIRLDQERIAPHQSVILL